MSSSEEEGEGEDEKDINIMDSGEDEMSRSSIMMRAGASFAGLDISMGDTQDAFGDQESGIILF